MALGSTKPLVKMITRNMPGGKGGRCVRLTTYHHTVPLSRNLGAVNFYNPLGLLRDCFTFLRIVISELYKFKNFGIDVGCI
jgi:hypothetical protein